ncbi:leucyl aminopeptidase family protein [Acidisoma cellulosilytica]|uniref:Leucyl aminopeptidase family protein n=1 Tax=Acidisoma cellulosilyticum TaxID=2802395 RepID=A0A963Z7I3_9PROT|nr:leucyl aminopeptidase family protein [Acidisoma cellulosilyticum]MCB8883268.1 leucyl aminopeptidase family protein [Acidisoma cellulosilyticum]
MRELDCLFDPLAAADSGQTVHRIHAVSADDLAAFLAGLPPGQRDFLSFTGFAAKTGTTVLLPAAGDGSMDAVLGLGQDQSHAPFGALPFALPAETLWKIVSPGIDPALSTLGFCLGAYRFNALKGSATKPARLARIDAAQDGMDQAWAICMGRDLINLPANLLGPDELAQEVVTLAQRFAAVCDVISGPVLTENYPTIAAVGRGSVRGPRVAILRWTGSKASDDAPLVSLCGKGVCFDSGGYDLKPSAGMLRMKKDMGGAAAMMALAALVMAADLPVRLVLRVGCVENSVSGDAMRPLDVIRTRSGRTVEIGNTDAEGRLVLCDLLDEAGAELPDIIIDAATLTGAARVALGPDLPALFSNNDDWSRAVVEAGTVVHDPVWALPLWAGYDHWLDSPVADLNNVSSNGFAGAITAALFLQRFVTLSQNWVHIDLYAWNERTRLASPEGGEVQAARGLFQALRKRYNFALQAF